MKRSLISSAVICMLSGCASEPIMDAVAESHHKAQAEVAAMQVTTASSASAPIILPTQKAPYLPQKSYARGTYKAEMPPALRSTRMVHVASQSPVTVEEFARLVAEEFKLPVKAESIAASGQAVQRELQPSVDLAMIPPQPLKEYLTTVTGLLGTDWDWQDDTLLIQKTFSRTYHVATSPETSDGSTKTGKQGTSTAGTGGTSGGGISGNFNSDAVANTKYNTDAWADLESALKQIAGDKNVVIGRTFNIAQVNCSKACHRKVKQFIDDGNHALAGQVLFHVMAINVAATKTGESGVDWTALFKTVLDSRKYRLGLNSPVSLVSTAAGQVHQILSPIGAVENGLESGAIVISALSGASKVIDKKPYTVLAANNTTAALNNIQQKSYTGSYTVVPSTILGGQPTYVGNPSFATFGQSLQVRPTVLPNGQIRVAFVMDDTSGKVDKGSSSSSVPEPDRVESNALAVSQTFNVRPGSTIILSSFKRTTDRSNAQGLLDGQRMGSETGTQEVTETILLVTPYIANAGGI